MLVVPVPDAGRGSPLQSVPRAEGPAEDPVGRGAGGKREGKSRFKIRDPLIDGRCSRAVPDFPSTTDVGRLMESGLRAATAQLENRQRRFGLRLLSLPEGDQAPEGWKPPLK